MVALSYLVKSASYVIIYLCLFNIFFADIKNDLFCPSNNLYFGVNIFNPELSLINKH